MPIGEFHRLPGDAPALWHPQGAWIRPGALVQAWLQTPGVTWQGNTRIARLERRGNRWHALAADGHEVAAAPLAAQDYAEQSGERRRQGFDAALKRRRLKPASREEATAIVAHNDLLALDLIDEIERGGRRVPQDVSVTGHDDIPLAAHSRIRLTTVRSDTCRSAAIAATCTTAAPPARGR